MALQGTNAEVDRVEAALEAMEGELKQNLQEVRRQLGGGSSICYVPLHKETHVLEVPQVRRVQPWSAVRHTPSGWRGPA